MSDNADPPPGAPSSSPWLVALALMNVGALAVGAWFIGNRLTNLEGETQRRLTAVEERLGAPARRAAAESPTGKPPPAEERDLGKAVQKGREEVADLGKALQKFRDEVYEYYSDTSKDLFDLKKLVRQVSGGVKDLGRRLTKPGAGVGRWGLAPAETAPGADALAQYAKDAEAAGVKVSPGRVEVRAFLNFSPKSTMPIEYFVTRVPEQGHETLVHVVGNVDLSDEKAPQRLQGLVTGIYKGMVAAGFMQGQESYTEEIPEEPPAPPGTPPKEKPADAPKMRWVPPTGDTVYVGVRYSLHGKTHVARATDWVIDPSIKGVLPADAFRFTGSIRIEDVETGDEELAAEAGGLVVSVYARNPTALMEIALASNWRDDYVYNYQRIPKPVIVLLKKGGPRLDVERDRVTGTLTVLGTLGGTSPTPLPEAPVLLVKTDDAPLEVPFERAKDGAWTVRHDLLKSGAEWRLRAKVGGETLESVGFEPLYLDLIFSKTPIQTEGDGSLPIEPVVLTGEEPSGMGGAPGGK